MVRVSMGGAAWSPPPQAGKGQGGACNPISCTHSPSPTLPRKQEREHTEFAARADDSLPKRVLMKTK